MKGPFPISGVVSYVMQNSKGAYILSRDGKIAHYIGRSDDDLQGRIQRSSTEGYGYKYFWFEDTTSPKRAYELECEWYHKYKPTDNSVHPAVPPGTNWRCPVAGCEWS
jgi:hypothetical protein